MSKLTRLSSIFITMLFLLSLAAPVLALERPDMVRPRFWETPTNQNENQTDNQQDNQSTDNENGSGSDTGIDTGNNSSVSNSTDCLYCSGGGTDIMTYPNRPGQFWAKRGSLILPLYNFGKFIRYKFFYAIDDGTGGQWFSKGTFKHIK